jgi:hypothetical protein
MSSPPSNWPHSIREINDLPPAEKHAIYQMLIPDWVFPMFGINPEDNTVRGTPVVHKRCPTGSSTVEISVYNVPESTEPVLYLHMGDTFNSQLIVLLVVVNDPASPRYDVDVDECGQPNQLGTRGRNIPEEVRAMEAGLAPGQVRRGLHVFRTAVPVFENFVARMGHNLFLIEPLFYHNAITFERYGFAYSRGFQTMKLLHTGFLPGGALHARLDGSTLFRQPEAWQTVTGRSWAIHDGISDVPFAGIQMYKRIGQDAGIETFPNASW